MKIYIYMQCKENDFNVYLLKDLKKRNNKDYEVDLNIEDKYDKVSTREDFYRHVSKDDILIGFNIDKVYIYLLSLFLQGAPASKIYKVYNDFENKNRKDIIRKIYKYSHCKYIDLKNILLKSKKSISLQEISIRLKNIDTSDTIENNLYTIEKLHFKLSSEIKIRDILSKEYFNPRLLNMKTPKIVEYVFTEKLKKMQDVNSVYNVNLENGKLENYEIPNAIKYDNKFLNEFYRDFEGSEDKLAFLKNKIINIKNGIYKLGSGGIHSKHNDNKYYDVDTNYKYLYIDVSSYYPNILIKNKDYFQTTFQNNFFSVYENFLKLREEAIEENEEINNQVYKLLLNGVIGKFNDKHSTLYYPSLYYKITITGQLLLLDLISRFESKEIIVIYTNTDGLIIKIRDDKKIVAENIMSDWEKATNLNLVRTPLKKAYFLNVNNYILLPIGKDPILGGIFKNISLEGAFGPDIINNLFINKLSDNNFDFSKEIRNNNNIFDYLIIKNELGNVGRYLKVINNQELNPIVSIDKDYKYEEIIDYDYYVKEVKSLYNNIRKRILIPCRPGEKVSKYKNWNSEDRNINIENEDNIAWVLESHNLVIDIDKKTNPEAMENAKKLFKYLNIDFFLNIKTPSDGGYHIYLEKDPEVFINNNHKDYEGIEFKSKGTYVLVPPSKIDNKEYKLLDEKVYKLNKLQNHKLGILFQINNKINNILDSNIESSYGKKSKEEIEHCLKYIDPDIEYPLWIKVGMSLHNWDNGGPIGLELWDQWSQGGSKYAENKKGLDNNYKYFKNDKDNRITIGSLINLARQNEDYKPLNSNDDIITTNWYEDWVYMPFPREAYINVYNLERHNQTSFNRENQIYVKPISDGKNEKRISPSAWLNVNKENIKLKVVYGIEYNPKTNDRIFYNNDGKLVLNSFNEDTLPTPVSENSEDGLKAIDYFKKHCNMLTDGQGDILLDYLSWTFQKRGVKIGWAILLGSKTQGIGKSFFLDLVSKMLGKGKNSLLTTIDNIMSNFSDYNDCKLMLLMHEYYTPTKEIKIIHNKLKSIITDETVVVNKKYAEPLEISTYSNAIFATNYMDCIHDAKDDRRMCFFYNITEANEIDFVKLKEETKLMMANYREILKFILERKISEDFNKDGRAPITNSKLRMIEAQNDDIEGLNDAQYLIKEKPCVFWNEDYIVTTELIAKIKIDFRDKYFKFNNYEIKKLKNTLNYIGSCLQDRNPLTNSDNFYKYSGDYHKYRSHLKFYFKKNLTKEEMKKIINNWKNIGTIQDDDDDNSIPNTINQPINNNNISNNIYK